MSEINHNQIIHKIIDYLPNEKIRLKKHEITGELQLVFENKNAIMTILKSNTWNEIKRHIDEKMSNNKKKECSICYSAKIKKRRVTCPKCSSDWCVECYVSIFKTNKGIIKCPFCRFTYGQEFPDYMIEIKVKQILESTI